MSIRDRAPRGSASGVAKITEEVAKQIRSEWRPGQNMYDRGNTAELMARFGLSKAQILRIAQGLQWRHLAS